MMKSENLQRLEKCKTLKRNADVKLSYCETIAIKETTEEDTITTVRILKDSDGRYYRHTMVNGTVTECFEIALSSTTSANGSMYFIYTEDGNHIFNFRVKNNEIEDTFADALDTSLVKEHRGFVYDGLTVEYISPTHISFIYKGSIKEIKVIDDYEFAYKFNKRNIHACGGAKGFFIWLESISYNAIHGNVLFTAIFNMIKTAYFPEIL